MHLVEIMKVLIQLNGLEKCEEALAEAWYATRTQEQGCYRSSVCVTLDSPSGNSGILKLLEHSIGLNVNLEIKAIPDELDALHLKEILNIFNDRRVTWGRKYEGGQTIAKDRGRWSALTLSGYNEHMKHVLEDRSMELFREVRITRSAEMEAFDITARLIPDPLINLVAAQAARGTIDFIAFISCWMSVYHTEVLKRIMANVALKSLVVREVQFTDPTRCLTRLAEGLETCKGIRNLEWLEINQSPSVHDPATIEHRCQLVRSLGRVANLRIVRTRLSLGSEDMAIAVSDLIRSNCQMEELDVAFEGDDSVLDGDAEEELDDHVVDVGNRLHSLWPALRRNTKLRKLRIEVDGSLFRYPGPPAPVVRCALSLAMSVDNTLSEILIDDPIHESCFPLSHFLLHSPILPAHEMVQCKVRVLKECLSNADVPTLQHLVRDRLPYLYDLGISARDSRDRRKWLVATCGEASPRVNEWDELQLQLEKNQVGMTLFHELVLPTVPAGLWPVVLAKATKGDIPTSGVYCILQKLIQSGTVRYAPT
jgi:hypothetical protein